VKEELKATESRRRERRWIDGTGETEEDYLDGERRKGETQKGGCGFKHKNGT